MICIDFDLLRSPYIKISYLLTLRYVLKFDNLYTTQCAKIGLIVGFTANVGNVFIELFIIFVYVFTIFNVFFISA